MDQAERKETAQHALVYVGIAVAVVIALVLLWYAVDVVLLAFIGILAAILLRAPADWLAALRIPDIVASAREQLSENEFGRRAVEFAEASGLFSGGEGQFLGRGLGLLGSTFGAIANVLIVLFFAVFMAAQPRLYVEGFLHLVARKKRARVREVLHEIGEVSPSPPRSPPRSWWRSACSTSRTRWATTTRSPAPNPSPSSR